MESYQYNLHESENLLAARKIKPDVSMLFFIGIATMLFASFMSSYLIRKNSVDWIMLDIPQILYSTSALLIASSFTFQYSKSKLIENQISKVKNLLLLTLLIGVAFIIGQIIVWSDLYDKGLFLYSNPHNSFFYILTGLHLLHFLGGICGIIFLIYSIKNYLLPKFKTRFINVLYYWHFMTLVWISVFIFIFNF